MRARLLLAALLALGCLGGAAAGDDLARALAETERQDGANSPYLLPLLEPLARQRFHDGKLVEAAELRSRALRIALGAFGSGSASAAEAMTALAQSYIDMRRYLDAEPLLTAAADVLGARVEADHPALANVFAGLARVALARGEERAGLAWAQKAAAVAAQNPHQRAAEPMLALSAALAANGRYDEAERAGESALARDRDKHGPDSVAAARGLSQLANVYLRANRPGAAVPLIEEAAAIEQAQLGVGNPMIGDDLYDLGLACDGLKRPEVARRVFAAAVKAYEAG
ncbi:MAG: tetratricopeptide repeat protein, partial [Alphaproteobacteria bacterium]|nr:tetratricopeptide repeat protein [Alphaproteobacteria bacterium]